jgi:ABC-2 type transport system permease protein
VLTAVVAPAATAGVIVAGDGWHARPLAGSVLYLILIGLLSLGVGAAVRQPAAAIGVVLGLLHVFPLLAAAVPGEVWQKRLERIGPMSAGLAVQATRGLPDLPISPGKGLAVLAAWTVAALLAGSLVLRFRDG